MLIMLMSTYIPSYFSVIRYIKNIYYHFYYCCMIKKIKIKLGLCLKLNTKKSRKAEVGK